MGANHRRVIQDPRRDAAAVAFLVGLIAFAWIPSLLAGVCEQSLFHLGLVAGPALLVAPIIIRSARTSAAIAATALFIFLLIVEGGIYFFVSLDECPLRLG